MLGNELLTKQMGHVMLNSTFKDFERFKVMTFSVGLRSQEKGEKRSLNFSPLESFKLIYRAPNSFNHGDCRIFKFLAPKVDSEFLLPPLEL